jgi:hypothetical protein
MRNDILALQERPHAATQPPRYAAGQSPPPGYLHRHAAILQHLNHGSRKSLEPLAAALTTAEMAAARARQAIHGEDYSSGNRTQERFAREVSFVLSHAALVAD